MYKKVYNENTEDWADSVWNWLILSGIVFFLVSLIGIFSHKAQANQIYYIKLQDNQVVEAKNLHFKSSGFVEFDGTDRKKYRAQTNIVILSDKEN